MKTDLFTPPDVKVYEITIKWTDFCHNTSKVKKVVKAPKSMPIREVEHKVWKKVNKGRGTISEVKFWTEELEVIEVESDEVVEK